MEDHSEFTDLDFIAGRQLGGVNAIPVDIGSVEAAHVLDREAGAAAHKLGVLPRDGHVIEEDIGRFPASDRGLRSEEHTSELQSRGHLVCRLLLEKKKTHQTQAIGKRNPAENKRV